MAIEVNSTSWTGNDDAERPVAPQVCGLFRSKEGMEEALLRLDGGAFDRSQISVRVPGQEDSSIYSTDETPVQEDDVRSLRTLGTSAAAAGLGMAAAGAVIATGGAALPAVAAAAAASGATLAAGSAAGSAATTADGDTEQQHAAEHGPGVIVMVSANTPDRQATAEQVLREAGAEKVWRQDRP